MSVPLADERHGNEPERRYVQREARVTTILLIGKLIGPHGEALCRIRNLSSGGLMAEVHIPLVHDDAVEIELKAGERLSGRVRWTRQGRMGIAFDKPLEVGTLLARAASRQAERGQARGPRFATDHVAELRADGRRHAVRLLNLSQGGAQLAADFVPEPAQLLSLAIPGLPERRAGIRWVGERALGVAFLEPLAFGELAAWLAGQMRVA